MKKKKIVLLLLSACVILGGAFSATACKNKGGDSSYNSESSISAPEGEMYFEVNNQELGLGETLTLTPVNGGSGITWTSTEEEIATVDETGKVTALSIGETIIKATKGNEVAMYRLAVIAARAEAVLSLDINKDSLTLYAGGTFTLSTAVLYGSTAVKTAVSYASTDKNILTVDENGVITAKAAGKSYVKVTANYEGKTAEKYVTVNVKETGNNMVINLPSLQLHKDDSFTLSATVSNGTEVLAENLENVTYTISDNSVATLNGNEIVGVAKGYVTVTAMGEYNGETLTCSVELRIRETYTVKFSSDGVVLESFEVLDGEIFENVMPTPVKAENRFIYWAYQGKEYTFTDSIEKDISLIALWNPYDFTQLTYGAYVSYIVEENGESVEKIVEGGVTAGGRHKDGLRFLFVQDSGIQQLHLPRIKYCDYTKVSFDWSVDGWAHFGQGEDLWYYKQGVMLEGTMTIYNMGDGQTLYIELTGNNGTYGKYIVDADILNGTKSLPMAALSYIPGRTFDMGPVSCSNEEVPSAISIEGNKVIAKQYKSEDELNGGWLFGVNNAVTKWTINLTAIDYSMYQSVTYRFRGTAAWFAIGFSDADEEYFRDSGKDDAPLNGTITVSYNTSTGAYTVEIYDSVTGRSVSKELTDNAVIYGQKGLSFYLESSALYRQFIVGQAQTVDL